MLRIGRTYELAITLHTLVVLPGSARPRMGSKLLFRGQQGTLSLELWKSQNKDLRGEIAPVFYTPAGEVRALPAQFEDAVRKVSGAVCCVGCKHSHVAIAPLRFLWSRITLRIVRESRSRHGTEFCRSPEGESTGAASSVPLRVDERGYPLGSCSVCDGGGGVTGCATCSGGGMLPSGRGATGLCPQCKGKGYQPHRFSRDTLVKAAPLRKQRTKKG
jgi:hypothetical protein